MNKKVSGIMTIKRMSCSSQRLIYPHLFIPFILVMSCFSLWGAANNLTDLLVPAFQKVLSMSQFQSSIIQSAFYGAYFCLALPAATLAHRFSYRTGILCGLIIYAIGAALCFPASQMMSFPFFLFAFYVFAAGCAILETIAAPYIMSMGPSKTATQRINLAQAFNPIGVLLGVYLGKEVILDGLHTASLEERASMSLDTLQQIQSQELNNVVTAYLVVGAVSLFLVFLILMAKLPKEKSGEQIDGLAQSFRRLTKNPKWRFSVIAQFFYVGCQISIWTYAIKYLIENKVSVTTESDASIYVLIGLATYAVSRFIFTYLMTYCAPAKLLCVMALVSSVLVSIVVFIGGEIGAYALVACYPCLSLMFPTIYGLGLSEVTEDRKLGGAIIIMAILGGATIVPLQGWLIDNFLSVNMSYLVPLFCFLVVVRFSIYCLKRS